MAPVTSEYAANPARPAVPMPDPSNGIAQHAAQAMPVIQATIRCVRDMPGLLSSDSRAERKPWSTLHGQAATRGKSPQRSANHELPSGQAS
jgi:hypothetical protein